MKRDQLNPKNDVGMLFQKAILQWAKSSLGRLIFFGRIAFRLWQAEKSRVKKEKFLGRPVPCVVALSPTMKCNYDCLGCYSKGRPADNELTTDELDRLFAEAEQYGVQSIVITGGEPLLRADLPQLIIKRKKLLFVMITNGSLVDEGIAHRFAASGNVIILISIEGWLDDTDERRKAGAHEKVLKAFKMLRDAHACFGFAAMVTRANAGHLTEEHFVNEMVNNGCAVGYFTEYVPCDEKPHFDWILDEKIRADFRRKVETLRLRKPIIIIQFPHDEYGDENRCTAAGIKSLHINSQGDIEPCPFAPVACENIRNGGLITAIQSRFLEGIRERPDLLKRKRYACALFEHRQEIKALAQRFKKT